MKIDLSKYLTERYKKSLAEQAFEGPVITIAREFGSPRELPPLSPGSGPSNRKIRMQQVTYAARCQSSAARMHQSWGNALKSYFCYNYPF